MSKWTRKQRAQLQAIEAKEHEFQCIREFAITESDRQRMCSTKRAYTKREAQSQINLFNRTKRGRHGNSEGLRPYQCPFCTQWHLTKDDEVESKPKSKPHHD